MRKLCFSLHKPPELFNKWNMILIVVSLSIVMAGCQSGTRATVSEGPNQNTDTAPIPTLTLVPSVTQVQPTATVKPSQTITVTPTFTITPTITQTPWPEDIYPPALPLSGTGAWQGAVGCPNLEGVQSASDFDPAVMIALMTNLLSGDKLRAQTVADQSLWPILPMPSEPQVPTEDWIKHIGPAQFSPFANLVKGQCGEEVLQKSWWANLCAGPCMRGGFVAIENHAFFIFRNGYWLVWAIQ